MTEVSTIGLDLAKNVFQVHGVDVSGETVIRPKECLIPTGINQNPWAHFRRPIDMIFQG